jgi:hypothetical protein
MPTDYDAPRRTETDDVSEDSLEELKARRNEAASAVVDVDETETAESFELPGADLSGEEHPVGVTAAHQPVRRWVVWVIEDDQNHRSDPAPVQYVGGWVELPAQRRRFCRTGNLS